MSQTYRFKFSFTKLGVASAPSPVPTVKILDVATDTLLVNNGALTASAVMPGVFTYTYVGAADMNLIGLAHTTDTSTDQQDLMSIGTSFTESFANSAVRLKFGYMKLGILTPPSATPTVNINNVATDTLLVTGGALKESAVMPGVYTYDYIGAAGLDIIGLAHTTDTSMDQQDLFDAGIPLAWVDALPDASTIFERTAAALASIYPAIPYALGQYLTANGASLPDTFIVYQEITGDSAQHSDDAEIARTYRIQVSIYARGGLVTLPLVDAAMIAQGFTKGPERQLPYDKETRHFGLAKDYFYLDG